MSISSISSKDSGAKVYDCLLYTSNVNVDGRQYMNKAMLDMKRNGDGTMSFRFRGMQGTSDVYKRQDPDNTGVAKKGTNKT